MHAKLVWAVPYTCAMYPQSYSLQKARVFELGEADPLEALVIFRKSC